MRIKETKVYKFDELSDEIKETAIEKYRESYIEYFWADDGVATLKEFCKQFDIELKDYSLDCGGCGQSSVSFNADTYSMIADEIIGMKAFKYLQNNYWHILHKPQFRGTIKNNTAYYSGIFWDDCCVLTGYYIDDIILQPIYDFLKRPDETTALKDLYDDCFNAFILAWDKDVKYQYSDESIIETIEANEYEFTVDGELA